MKILAIETSCDDTGIAILDIKEGKTPDIFSCLPAGRVLANKIASQIKVHQKYGGVFPMMAKREHQKNIVPTFIEALKEAKILDTNKPYTLDPEKLKTLKTILEREPELEKKLIPFLKKYSKPNVDFISVTNGPGLEPCLWVGVNFARALSYFWDIPLIPINHIEGHILVNYLENNKIEFPAVSLIVSGGHTQIILIEDIGKYKILGETRDDAAGECFDKAAKILGLSYPGGPIISKLALQVTNYKLQVTLPRPMLNTKDYDFSFSGLKTAILYFHQKQLKKVQKNNDYICAMCAEIQQAIIDVLLKKTLKAVKDFNAKTIILGGGVSANSELKNQFQKKSLGQNVKIIFPKPILSTDNGLMIAVAAYFNHKKINNWENLKADSNLRIGE